MFYLNIRVTDEYVHIYRFPLWFFFCQKVFRTGLVLKIMLKQEKKTLFSAQIDTCVQVSCYRRIVTYVTLNMPTD